MKTQQKVEGFNTTIRTKNQPIAWFFW